MTVLWLLILEDPLDLYWYLCHSPRLPGVATLTLLHEWCEPLSTCPSEAKGTVLGYLLHRKLLEGSEGRTWEPSTFLAFSLPNIVSTPDDSVILTT